MLVSIPALSGKIIHTSSEKNKRLLTEVLVKTKSCPPITPFVAWAVSGNLLCRSWARARYHPYVEGGKEAVVFGSCFCTAETPRKSPNRPPVVTTEPAVQATLWQGQALYNTWRCVPGPQWGRNPSTGVGLKLCRIWGGDQRWWRGQQFSWPRQVPCPWSFSQGLDPFSIPFSVGLKKRERKRMQKGQDRKNGVDRCLWGTLSHPERNLDPLFYLLFVSKGKWSTFERSKSWQENIRISRLSVQTWTYMYGWF